ncbi:MAG: aspartate dehydrogenase [Blautia sp.]|nr:aspartate dehydrogenase [Blautia sp.]
MFGKKKVKPLAYDEKEKTPVIHQSICNGERVGGFKIRSTKRFEEVMVIRNEEDLRIFKEMVQKEQIPTEY